MTPNRRWSATRFRLFDRVISCTGVTCFFGAILLGQEVITPTPPKQPPPMTDQWAGKPAMTAEHVREMVSARILNAPKVGEKAPPFALTDPFSGRSVSLSQIIEKRPAVLFFASFSCCSVQDSVADVSSLSERFGDLAQFVLIYIQEAHPEGGFLPPVKGDPFIIPAPRNFTARSTAALKLASQRNLRFPILVDTMDDATAVRWGAWPIRLFMIDRTGTVVFAGQQGPWFHKPTRTYDPELNGVPESYRDLPGYSKGSLEEFLEQFAEKSRQPSVSDRP